MELRRFHDDVVGYPDPPFQCGRGWRRHRKLAELLRTKPHRPVDEVVRTVPVDDKRIGISGWSYGGFMTMWSVTQTRRFNAAVAGAGIANWQSYYGQNLIDQWMIPFLGASVYDDPAAYEKSSPIRFIKNVKTATL